MVRFLRLIQNESIKIWAQISTKIMVILIVAGCVAMAWFMNYANGMSYESSFYEMDIHSYIDQLNAENTPTSKDKVEVLKAIPVNEVAANSIYEKAFTIVRSYEDYDFKTLAVTVKNNDWQKFYSDYINYLENSSFKESLTQDSSYLYAKYVVQYGVNPEENSQFANIVLSLAENESTLSQNPSKETQQKVQIAKYQLDNKEYFNTGSVEEDIMFLSGPADKQSTFWATMYMSTGLSFLIGLLAIVIAGGIVASEFSSGTIKFLLVNPVKRWKILMSKYATLILSIFAMLILMFVMTFISSGIFNSFQFLREKHLYVDGDVVKSMPGMLYVLKDYLTASITPIVMATLAFMISSLLRNSSFAVGISMLAMLGGTVVIAFLQGFNLDWARFLIFANLDVLAISEGNSMFMYHTVGLAVGVIVVHMVLFLLTAWDAFTKREV